MVGLLLVQILLLGIIGSQGKDCDCEPCKDVDDGPYTGVWYLEEKNSPQCYNSVEGYSGCLYSSEVFEDMCFCDPGNYTYESCYSGSSEVSVSEAYGCCDIGYCPTQCVDGICIDGGCIIEDNEDTVQCPNGIVPVSCKCGSNSADCTKGEYCDKTKSTCTPVCPIAKPATANCKCGTNIKDCTVGETCDLKNSTCKQPPECPTGKPSTAPICTCGTEKTDCKAGETCHKETSKCVPACPATGPATDKCQCGTTECAEGQTCDSTSTPKTCISACPVGSPATGTCTCGTSNQTDCTKGETCHAATSLCLPACPATEPATGKCQCGTTECAEGQTCDSTTTPKTCLSACPATGPAPGPCRCGTTDCVKGEACHAATSTCTVCLSNQTAPAVLENIGDFTKFALSCPSKHALREFQLAAYIGSEYVYKYTCCPIDLNNPPTPIDHPTNPTHFQPLSQSVFPFTKQDVSCNLNSTYMTGFQMKNAGDDTMNYEVNCVNLATIPDCTTSVLSSVLAPKLPFTDLIHLNVKCPQNKFLQKFQLQNDTADALWYDYTCCN